MSEQGACRAQITTQKRMTLLTAAMTPTPWYAETAR